MRLMFSGFEGPVTLERGRICTLAVGNPTLFARVCQSLSSEKGESAVEPYSLWDEAGDRIKPKDALIMVYDPFSLPWGHRLLGGKLYARFQELFLEDDKTRDAIERLNQEMAGQIAYYGFSLSSDYSFGTAWDLPKYLKAFSYGVDYDEDEPLFENLIKLLGLAADVGCSATLAFVNLKKFLSEKDLELFAQQIFFLNLKVLLLESGADDILLENERKSIVDLHFLESF